MDITASQAAQIARNCADVDETMVAARIQQLWSRSVKGESQRQALLQSVRMTDLTTLEGADTPGRVAELVAKAHTPAPNSPPTAAVCVYPSLVPAARAALDALHSPVKLASVASSFPAGQVPMATRLEDIRFAVEAGADEIDVVISRGAFLAGRFEEVFEELVAFKAACKDAHMKTILETGELGSLTAARQASWLAMLAGSDFVKTSTGKVSEGATPATTWVLLESVKDFQDRFGVTIGVKAAGGIRSAKDAVRYLILVAETASPEWLTPDLFRFGASSLLDDLLMQIDHSETSVYRSLDEYPWG